MKHTFRPTAIPLAVNDPYLSIWSFTDKLYDDSTRHWTGHSNSMCGVLFVDGTPFRFMGKAMPLPTYFEDESRHATPEQTSVEVRPTTTVYTFEHTACTLKVTFLTPLLLDRPEVFSRPVSYVFYEISPKESGHTFRVYLDLFAEIAGDCKEQEYTTEQKEGDVSLGIKDQTVLGRCGDDVRIDWGYLHLVHPNAKIGQLSERLKIWSGSIPYSGRIPLLSASSEALSDRFVIAYDDIKSVDYFHTPVDAYYKTVYGDFDTMLKAAVAEADALRADCAAFDAAFMKELGEIGEEYAAIGALAYRQSIAAHKLVSVDGKMMFFSKECYSNGCMATLDVTYPSIPLFLHLNPELVRGMMRPLLIYATSKAWPYRYAPHDCGCYPFCNGQVYSTRDGELIEQHQMPIEECGNAILTIAAALRADGDRSLAEEYHALLKQWADYLVEFGYDPENQLCTDDFAGHLAHNCNLSLKAITALGAYAQMYDEPHYAEVAKDMATRWAVDAKKQDGKGWRLTFDRDDTWSLKYNIIWDRLLGLGLFDAALSAEEIEVYEAHMNRYGVPLDSRSDYTKLDWLAWTTVMTDNKEYTDRVYEAIALMISETWERVPITDWYYTSDPHKAGAFQARSVLGGFYINLVAKTFLA